MSITSASTVQAVLNNNYQSLTAAQLGSLTKL